MGRLFVIQFDQTPDSRIFLCNTCHTHMASQQEVICMVKDNDSVLLDKAVSVVVDNQEDYYLKYCFGFRIVAANLYCIACNTLLGYKLIEVHSFHESLREGGLMLKLQKLLYWNGQQMIEALPP